MNWLPLLGLVLLAAEPVDAQRPKKAIPDSIRRGDSAAAEEALSLARYRLARAPLRVYALVWMAEQGGEVSADTGVKKDGWTRIGWIASENDPAHRHLSFHVGKDTVVRLGSASAKVVRLSEDFAKAQSGGLGQTEFRLVIDCTTMKFAVVRVTDFAFDPERRTLTDDVAPDPEFVGKVRSELMNRLIGQVCK